MCAAILLLDLYESDQSEHVEEWVRSHSGGLVGSVVRKSELHANPP